MVWLDAVALVFAATTSPSPSQAAAAGEVVVPAPTAATNPQEAAFQPFIGRWNIVATTPGSAETTRFTYEVAPWLTSAWLTGHAVSVPPGEESRDIWGRDSASGELIRIIFADNGTYAVVRSAGWQGNRLVLEGDARSAGGIVRVRETIERRDEDSFVATWEALRDGTWSIYSVELVTRAPGSAPS